MSSPITPEGVIYELTGVSSPALSSDGNLIAFISSRVEKASNQVFSQLMLARFPEGRPFPFTHGGKDSAPSFSPDGRMLAFLRPDGKERRQIWLISVNGGEARALTSAHSSIGEFAWSPDSRFLAFVADVDPDVLPEDHDLKKNPRVRVVRRIRYRHDVMGWRGDAHRHIFVVDVCGGEPKQVTEGEGDDSAIAWSPDGVWIAFVSDRIKDRDTSSHNELYVVPSAGGEPIVRSQGLFSINGLAWGPDSESLAVIGSDNPDLEASSQGTLFLLRQGMPPRRLTKDSIALIPAVHWIGEERLLFVANSKGESYLYELVLVTGRLEMLAGGAAQIGAMSADGLGDKVAIVASTPGSPGDLYLVDVLTRNQHQLTEYNKEYLDEHPPALLEKHILSRSGMEIESRLWFPHDFDTVKRYPLVVEVHGGPHGAFYDAFNPVHQVLASAGYLVLCVNPRGSSTYGSEFVEAVQCDWGGEDYLDIMGVVDEMCERPYVDSSRLGIHGYSYGGFMTSWAIGHTTRFGAAVIGAPVTDLCSMSGTSDIGISFGERQWGGKRHENIETYLEHSALTYAPEVQTPVLLLHGESDVRCPIEQSEQYFVALKRLGKEVEFVRFPGCSHGFTRDGHPVLRLEYLNRVLAWFRKHLQVKIGVSGGDHI